MVFSVVGLTFGGMIAGPAGAATIDAATILHDFNAVIYTNGSTTSDIEGAAVIGGNFSGATIYNNPGSTKQPAGYGALTVFGSTSGNDINMNNGGNAYVGGTKGAKINFNGGGSYISAPGSSISSFSSVLNNLSSYLSTLNSTSTVNKSDLNDVIFNAAPNSQGIAVFDIDASVIDSAKGYSLALNGAKTVIFNVTGTTIDVTGNLLSGLASATSTIWNFYEATNVTLQTQFAGTVLADQAAVVNDNQIDGTLVARSWTGNGELHNYGFSGVLPTEIPEPETVFMLGCGLLALAGISLRRRPTTRH
jgi:choice-of-anchor A domain-containing protein